MGAPHKFESEETHAILLNSECSGNNDIRVIWYSGGDIFDLIPGYTTNEIKPDAKKSLLKNDK